LNLLCVYFDLSIYHFFGQFQTGYGSNQNFGKNSSGSHYFGMTTKAENNEKMAFAKSNYSQNTPLLLAKVACKNHINIQQTATIGDHISMDSDHKFP
jgi:hypothetical protein